MIIIIKIKNDLKFLWIIKISSMLIHDVFNIFKINQYAKFVNFIDFNFIINLLIFLNFELEIKIIAYFH
jgi:hypothetical protein